MTFLADGGISSNHYYLIPCDLRDTINLENLFIEKGFDFHEPTLFISECVLIYMKSEQSSKIVEWCANKFDESYFVLYEQVEPYDNFGKKMIENLNARGCPLLSILTYPTIEDQRKRFISLHWENVDVLTMKDIYNKHLSQNINEIHRIQNIEMLDELEEWNMIHEHYFILFASQNKNSKLDNQKVLSFKNLTFPPEF